MNIKNYRKNNNLNYKLTSLIFTLKSVKPFKKI